MTDSVVLDASVLVFAGIDTHAETHHVGLIDADGRRLADAGFATTVAGYRELLGFVTGAGDVGRVGVEGTGSYGAQVTALLQQRGLAVVEVDRPDRRARRARGKSDPIDAYAAADAVRTGRATTPPKVRSGDVEALRVHSITRASAMKARTQAANQVAHLLVTAPVPVRDRLRNLTGKRRYRQLARLRSDEPAQTGLRRLGRRWLALTAEIDDADTAIAELLAVVAPELLAHPFVGPQTAATLLMCASANPDRLARGDASFAALTGVSPLLASTGKTHRHRLNRGGNRDANAALWRICWLRFHHGHQPTQVYRDRRAGEQLTDREIIRCLKRFLVRELLPDLRRAVARLHAGSTTGQVESASRVVSGQVHHLPTPPATRPPRLRGQGRPQAVATRSRQRPLRPEKRPRTLRGAP